MIHLYGIPNCETVKKARTWLDARGVAFAFHDYKKEGADPAKLAAWSDADKADIDRAKALRLMEANPSLIKRPVVEHAGGVLVGFDRGEWEAAL